MDFKSAEKAIKRAGRDAGHSASAIAVQQTVDTETGEALEEPVILAQHGEVLTAITGD